MAYSSYDPRTEIRLNLTSEVDLFSSGVNQRVISILNTDGNTYEIPIYLTEEVKSDALPPMPFIVFGLLHNNSLPQDIGAETRKERAIIDCHIVYQKHDDIDQHTLGFLIANRLVGLVMAKQTQLISGTSFVSAYNSARVIEESGANQVIYHIIIEIEAVAYS